MTVGQTHQLGKIVGPSDAKVHWNVANDNIATIDKTGKITALAPGSTIIWIEVSKFEVTETAAFTLTVELNTIINRPENDTLTVGQTHTLSIKPICNNITWNSSDKNVATINNKGEINTIKTGKTEISAICNGIELSFILTVDSLLIYQTKNTLSHRFEEEDKFSEYPIYAEDLKYGDLSKEDILKLPNIIEQDLNSTADFHRLSWESMCTTFFATEPLESVIKDMIEKFMNGETETYKNATLTQKVKEHESTINYVDSFKNQLNNLIKNYHGNISSLKYTASNRTNHPMVQKLRDNDIYEPVFDTLSDKINGLTICIDSLWGNKVEMTSYKNSENGYEGILKFTLYDHFGLDEIDLVKYNKWGYGFTSWYILQHYSGYAHSYKPFITLIEFDVPFSGQL